MRITSFQIRELVIRGLRCYREETHLSFDYLNLISGDNGIGKTSIAHAIAYVLYGVNVQGEEAYRLLLSQGSTGIFVKLVITDGSGTEHIITRQRNGDKTYRTFDGNPARQTDLDGIFGNKELFLALFHPNWFIEQMENGRAFLEFYLPPVSNQDVISQMTPREQEILSKDLFITPEDGIRISRAKIRELENRQIFLSGKKEALEAGQVKRSVQAFKIKKELCEKEKRCTELEKKQFAGIDRDDLSLQRLLLENTLAESEAENCDQQRNVLQGQLQTVKSREYHSPNYQKACEIAAAFKSVREKQAALSKRLSAISAGDQCPVCFARVTHDNLPEVRKSLKNELDTVLKQENALKARKNELLENEQKAKEAFRLANEHEISRITGELRKLLMQKHGPQSRQKMREDMEGLNETLRLGNLTEDEFLELSTLRAEIKTLLCDRDSLQKTEDAALLPELEQELDGCGREIRKLGERVKALQEFQSKKAQITMAHIKMPHTEIRLYEVVPSTGEYKPAFKFLYAGREYASLSLSEKVKAGIEVAWMLRGLIHADYPLFIDNCESIGNLASRLFPSQTFLLRFEDQKKLTVRRGGKPAGRQPYGTEPLKKVS